MEHITVKIRKVEYELLKELVRGEREKIVTVAHDAIDLYIRCCERTDPIKERVKEMLENYKKASRLFDTRYRTIKIRTTDYKLLKEQAEKEQRSVAAVMSDALDLYVGYKRPDLIRKKIEEKLRAYEETSKQLFRHTEELHRLLSAAQEGYYPSPFAESREVGHAVGVIQAVGVAEVDEALRRRMDEIAAGIENLLKTLEAAKEQKEQEVGRTIKEYDRMIQQLKALSQQYEGIVQLIR